MDLPLATDLKSTAVPPPKDTPIVHVSEPVEFLAVFSGQDPAAQMINPPLPKSAAPTPRASENADTERAAPADDTAVPHVKSDTAPGTEHPTYAPAQTRPRDGDPIALPTRSDGDTPNEPAAQDDAKRVAADRTEIAETPARVVRRSVDEIAVMARSEYRAASQTDTAPSGVVVDASGHKEHARQEPVTRDRLPTDLAAATVRRETGPPDTPVGRAPAAAQPDGTPPLTGPADKATPHPAASPLGQTPAMSREQPVGRILTAPPNLPVQSQVPQPEYGKPAGQPPAVSSTPARNQTAPAAPNHPSAKPDIPAQGVARHAETAVTHVQAPGFRNDPTHLAEASATDTARAPSATAVPSDRQLGVVRHDPDQGAHPPTVSPAPTSRTDLSPEPQLWSKGTFEPSGGRYTPALQGGPAASVIDRHLSGQPILLQPVAVSMGPATLQNMFDVAMPTEAAQSPLVVKRSAGQNADGDLLRWNTPQNKSTTTLYQTVHVASLTPHAPETAASTPARAVPTEPHMGSRMTSDTHVMSTPQNAAVQVSPSVVLHNRVQSQAMSAGMDITVSERTQTLAEPDVIWDLKVTPNQPATPAQAARVEAAPPLPPQIAEALVKTPHKPIEIALNPAELGRVRMVLAPSETGMVVLIQADRPDTLDLMRRNADDLGQSLADLGYEDVSFSFDQGQQQETSEDPSPHGSAQAMPPDSGAPGAIDSAIPPAPRLAIAPDAIDMRF